jgi:hypothetical protein
MYDKGKKFLGSFGTYIKDLVVSYEYFPRNTDELSLAPMIGYIYATRCSDDISEQSNNADDTKQISGEQVEHDHLDFVLRVIALRECKNFTSDQDMEDFRKMIFSKNFDKNSISEFEQYTNGGLKIMHDKLCKDVDPSSAFEKSMKMCQLLEEINSRI